jgi:hypothetical protein
LKKSSYFVGEENSLCIAYSFANLGELGVSYLMKFFTKTGNFGKALVHALGMAGKFAVGPLLEKATNEQSIIRAK